MELFDCPNCKLPFTKEELRIKEHCFNCGWEFAEAEFIEREQLLELQRSRTRWFSQQEFDRLKELNDKLKLKHETKIELKHGKNKNNSATRQN